MHLLPQPLPPALRTLPRTACLLALATIPFSAPAQSVATFPNPGLAGAPGIPAQSTASPSEAPAIESAPEPLLTLFPHSQTARWWVSGQANSIFQAHPGFHSPYEGINSLHAAGEYKASEVGTVYIAVQPTTSIRYATDLIIAGEQAGGRGISQALGLAGATNLDVVRNPTLGAVPYLSRVQIHQVIGLTDETIDAERGPFALSTKTPVRRIELRFGKMTLPDYLDLNSVGSDSHLQFTNWTIDNNGAWDYAADTRGYTYAGIAEYDDSLWSFRYAIAAMPTVANGINLDWAISRARGQNFEFELRKSLIPARFGKSRHGTSRVLSFVNAAHMGSYREAIQAYLDGRDPTPTITAHEHFGAIKYGFGYNLEQELTSNLRAFARFGWNEGQHESFAYTEVDQTFLFGADFKGSPWARPNDKIGAAFVTNAIKKDHQTYLKLGGLGFLIGDGRLHYAREDILESYYNAHLWRGVYSALSCSFIEHPGYNQDRGPVIVPGVRLHIDY